MYVCMYVFMSDAEVNLMNMLFDFLEVTFTCLNNFGMSVILEFHEVLNLNFWNYFGKICT